MSEVYRVEDLSADEIRELLATEGNELTLRQALTLRDFVDRIGGIENAALAVELLDDLEDAA